MHRHVEYNKSPIKFVDCSRSHLCLIYFDMGFRCKPPLIKKKQNKNATKYLEKFEFSCLQAISIKCTLEIFRHYKKPLFLMRSHIQIQHIKFTERIVVLEINENNRLNGKYNITNQFWLMKPQLMNVIRTPKAHNCKPSRFSLHSIK